MYIDKQKWDIILDGLHLSDKEKIVAEAIRALLNQAPKPKEIMDRVIVDADKEKNPGRFWHAKSESGFPEHLKRTGTVSHAGVFQRLCSLRRLAASL